MGKLLLPACRRCGPFFYPRILCPRCHTDELAWIEASGRGAIYSFTVAYQAFHPEFKLPPPYVLALVELDEGPRVLSGLVDVEPDPNALRCGMRVEARFEAIADDVTLLLFRPAAPTATEGGRS